MVNRGPRPRDSPEREADGGSAKKKREITEKQYNPNRALEGEN